MPTASHVHVLQMEDDALPVPDAGQPLLPTSVASTITFSTETMRGAVRTARTVGRVPFYAARYTTTAGLELGRQAYDILWGGSARSADPAGPRGGKTSSPLQMLAAAGFELTGGSVAALLDLTEVVLAVIDGTLGSTESSRAIRSILAFLSREFQNPATGRPGEKVGVRDLLWGVCALAYLQAACRRADEEEQARRGVDVVVWDVIVLDGQRVDVHEQSLYGQHGQYDRLEGDSDGDDIAVEDEDEPLETTIRRQIAAAATSDSTIVVTTRTAKTITVDITGSQPPLPIAPMPGVELVELGPVESSAPTSAYRVVFRTTDTQTATMGPTEPPQTNTATPTAAPAGLPPIISLSTSPEAPPVPPKTEPSLQYSSSLHNRTHHHGSDVLPRTSSRPQPAQDSRANQKKARQPAGKQPQQSQQNTSPSKTEPEKKSNFRSVLKRPGLANLLHKETSSPSKSDDHANHNSSGRTLTVVQPPKRPTTPPESPKAQRVLTPLTARALNRYDQPEVSSSNGNTYYGSSVNGQSPYRQHRKRRSFADDLESLASFASMAESFAESNNNMSVHTTEAAFLRPGADGRSTADTSSRGHRRLFKRASIYTLHTNDSQASVMVYGNGRAGGGGGGIHGGGNGNGPNLPRIGGSANDTFLAELRRSGHVAGLFPDVPLPDSLCRYMRFSSAAYGHDFLRVMGIAKTTPSAAPTTDPSTPEGAPRHRDVVAYARHTGLQPEDILLASFIDVDAGVNSGTGLSMPLVHYVALDHARGAVVLACRGTLGFDDVLADMAFDYDNFVWRGRTYQVHKGVHAAARRLLLGGDGRVLATLREALVDNPDYGLVLCGHSLGGAVTALLGVMLSEGNTAGLGGGPFVTATGPKLLANPSANTTFYGPTDPEASAAAYSSQLPSGRPIHVYAYGPPGTMCENLRRATRGLITSVAHGRDVVPYLSLGVLHDMQAVALALKTDHSRASAELWSRLWDVVRGVVGGAVAKMSVGATPAPPSEAPPDDWAYASLKTLRASMLSAKLVPPGEVLSLDTQTVLQRMPPVAGAMASDPVTVSPARRVVLRYVRDVEMRFRELSFGVAALVDHSPGRYEAALNQLAGGVHL